MLLHILYVGRPTHTEVALALSCLFHLSFPWHTSCWWSGRAPSPRCRGLRWRPVPRRSGRSETRRCPAPTDTETKPHCNMSNCCMKREFRIMWEDNAGLSTERTVAQSHLLPFRNLGNFVHPTFACVFRKRH